MNKNINTRNTSYLIMLLPPLFWSGNFIVGRALATQNIPITLSFYRWLFAFLLLTPFAIVAVYRQRSIIRQHISKLALLAFFGISAFNTLAYIGLQFTTATNATLLNSFIPIYILLISSNIMGNSLSRNQIVGLVISMCGIIVLLTKLSPEIFLNFRFNQGDLWMLVATLDWAIYSILLKKYKPVGLDNLSFLWVLILFGVIFLTPLYFFNPFGEASMTMNTGNLSALVYIAIFPSLIAFLAWNYGISKIGPEKGGQFVHLMPLFGIILAIIFLNETIHLYHIVGIICISSGLWLSLRKV